MKFSSTQTNIFTNLGGKMWAAVISILFVPIYLRYLNVEVYGIVGVFASLQAVLSLLDVGIAPTLSREVARLSAFPEKSGEIRDLARTLEIPYWIMAFFIGLIAFSLAPLIGRYWVQGETLSIETITQSLMIMSLGATFSWAGNLYSGGLLGLQRVPIYNLINVSLHTIRAVGSVLVLIYVSQTVQAFLLWHGICSMATCLAYAAAFWSGLPKSSSRPKFRRDLLSGIWRYAAGMTGISLLLLALTQIDKVILSKMLTLENFGYYSLATMMTTMGLGMIISSISNVYLPKFSQLVVLNDDATMRSLYHRSSQIMSVFLIPATIIMSFFSFELLLLWTGDAKIAENTSLILTLVAIGTGLNGLMHLPYYVQLANGVTKIAFWQNAVAVILLIPLVFIATDYYGGVGGAAVWVIINLFAVLIGMQVMHRYLLKGELTSWYIEDIGIQIITVCLVAGAFRYLFRNVHEPINIFLLLSFVSITVFISCVLVSSHIRQQLFYRINVFRFN